MQKESQVAKGTSDREILISRIVNAPRELVWQAMTDPHHACPNTWKRWLP
jgi:uncharacterized protein YndB with AHSA1/START domain